MAGSVGRRRCRSFHGIVGRLASQFSLDNTKNALDSLLESCWLEGLLVGVKATGRADALLREFGAVPASNPNRSRRSNEPLHPRLRQTHDVVGANSRLPGIDDG
jgi:hypothetical protein